MAVWRTAVWLIVAVAGWMVTTAGSASAADQVTIAVAPASITPSLHGATTAAVLTTNNADVPITVRLTMQANQLIAPHDFGPARTVAAHGSIAWDLPIRRVAGPAAPNSVLISATYSLKGTPGELTTVTSVPISVPPGAFDIGKATVAADGSAIRVDDVHDSQFAVEISNSSQQAVSVDSLNWTFPGFVEVRLADAVTVPFILPGNTSISVPFSVRGVGALERGSNQIRLAADLSWDRQHGSLATVQQLDVGAFGESQIGDLLTIPTMLVLPGAVVLALLAVLWALNVRPVSRDSTTAFPVTGALQVGVTLLLLSAVAILGNRLLTGRSLLAGYGSRDILVLVLSFAAVALVVYLAVCWFFLESRRRKAADAKQIRDAEALQPGMTPGDLLARLAVRKSDLWVSRAMQRTGSGKRLVLLPNDDRPDEPTLVCVPIEVTLAKGQDRPGPNLQRMEQDLCQSLRPGRPAGDIIAILAAAGADAENNWRPAKNLSGLETAEKDSLETLPGKAPLVYLA